MTTVMSAIGEATGMKPSDESIAITALAASKMKAQTYLTATLEAATPELRQIFAKHLQDIVAEQHRYADLAIKKGWYKAHSSIEELVRQAVAFAQPMVKS